MITVPVRAPLSGPGSELRRDLTGAPVHAQSWHVVAHLVEQTTLATPNVNIARFNLALYEVGDDVPGVDVTWRNGTAVSAFYAGLLGTGALPGLPGPVGPFVGVPIPAGAVPAAGTDGALAIHRRSTGELWELWQATSDGAGGWTASWGGYTPDVLTAAGSYTRNLGVSASGLLMAPTVVTIAEARAGLIEHAVGLAVPAVVGKVWSHPAVRCDAGGTSTAPYALHEGQRFRLRPDVDLDAATRPGSWAGAPRLPLTPLAKAIGRAAQRFGFIVTDRAGCVAVSTESGAPAKAATGVDPWVGLRRGVPEYLLLSGFPWAALEALPFDYGRDLPPGTPPVMVNR